LDKKKLFLAGAILYGVVLFFLMSFWRLPAERLLPYFVERYSKGRLIMRAERSAPSFPLGYTFERVSYGLVDGNRSAVGRLKSLYLGTGLLRLIAGYLPVSFTGYLPDQGMIRGRVGISMFESLQKGYLELGVSGLHLDDMAVIDSFSNRKVRGVLNGEMKLKGNLVDPTRLFGEGRFILQKGSVDTRMDVAGLKAVPFEMIRLPFTLKDGVLTLENVEMEGPMFSGTVSGQIRLNKVLGSSPLQLTARLKAGPGLKNNPLAGALLAKIQKGKEQIVLKIGGSIQAPSMNWGGI
jgi:type II secretion system protein N